MEARDTPLRREARARAASCALASSALRVKRLLGSVDRFSGHMIRLEGYTLGPRLLADPHHEVYAARRDADGLPVLIKVGTQPASAALLAQLRKEHELLRRIDARGVARPLALVEEPPALVLQATEGVPLGRYAAEHPPSMSEFLAIAVQLAEAVAAVHEARIVHKDLQPGNILIAADRLAVQLVDFGRAAEIGQIQRDPPSGGLREGTLLYLAPEQTGGVDAAIDFRSDLYSLGATLYELLTGSPPFEGEPSELIRSHLSRVPVPPHERAVDVPEAISRVVCKLLEKAPEARYQSARGLRADLLVCTDQLSARGAIDPNLALGARDTPGRLAFPRKLYGRERELQQLRDAFVRTAKGRTELCLLSGPPGVGKSRTANELRSAVAQASGHFAAGRFDRFRSDMPCAGFVEAFGSLVDQILTESDARLATWKTEISAGLGNLARVLVDLVPGLKLIVENPPPLPRVGSKETTQRLALAICRFIQTVARSDAPLVLFLDDLQWADSASRYLLEEILCTEPTRALLIIGAYQEREVDASHPLLHLLARLEREDVAVQTLQLDALSPEQCTEMLADTLGERVERVQPLAELVRRKTGNVPLHVQQFLLHLQGLGLLQTDAASRWTWDQEAIAASDIPEDVVAMLEAKLARLEQGARELLKIASCVGASFEGDTLAELAGRDRESVGREALRLVEEGLLVPCREGFRFVHERLREVAQALGSEAERERLHHRVAQLLLSRTPEESLDDHIFEIADHLQRASSLIGDDERVRAIELQLRAGARALSRGGFEAARGYLQVGRRLARETDWERAPAAMYALHLHAAEAAALLGEYAEADAILDALEKRPLDVFERARVQAHRVAMYTVTRPPAEAVRVALAGLRERGIRWSEQPSRLYVRWTLLRTRWKLRGRSPEQLSRPCPKPEPDLLATLTLLFEMASPAYRLDVNLGALVTTRAAALTIAHGAVGASPALALGSFAQAYAVTTGDYDYAAHVARLATRLRELGDDGPQAYKALFSTDLLVNGWCRHRRKALEALRLVRTQALEAGDVSYAVYAWNQRALVLLLVGEPLAAVERELRESGDFGRRAGYREWGTAARCSHFVRALTGRDEEIAAEVGLPESSIGVSLVALLAGMRAYHLGRLDEAHQQIELAEAHLARAGSNLPHVSEICFYGGLTAAGLAGSALGRARRAHLRKLRACARSLRRWARVGPDNFEHQALLLEAELARLGGDSEEALYLYALASEAATTQGYRQHAAIVNERRGLLSLELGGRREPWRFIRAAIAAFDEWGARAVADRLRQEHSELLLAYATPDDAPAAVPRTSTTAHAVAATTVTSSTALKDTRTLDLTTVLRSSEAISGEVRLEHVLERVMSIAIENAGAQTALLLLEHNGELRIEARGAVGTSAARLSEPLATSESGNLLPVNLVQYVQRTRKTVVLRDAASEGLFVEDPYIMRNHVKSILCLPIIRQTKLVGVLYLENNLVTDAFTENRVEVLALLSSHAAISLDNARLYGELVELNRDLERRVEERTLELRDARDAAEAATRAKSEFLAVMSHEIRTPMNVVIGMAQLLKEMSLSTEQLDCIQAVHTAGDSLLTIINDILDFSKIEAGKLELEDVAFSVRDCVEDVAEILGPRAHDKGLDFPVHVPALVPDRLFGDPGRLKQVLLNFVSNAIKFTEKGEIGVRVSHSITEGEQVRLRFEIKDTGIGIPASRLDRLFRSFSQVDASTTRRYGGTGLGLAIAKRLAEAMGGMVGVESEEAVGSTFWFEVVLRPERVETAQPAATLAAIRSLVLVEHAASAEALCEQLRTLGAQAQAAASGEQLRALAQTLAPGPIAVLARYPFENPAWRAELGSVRERAGVSIFLLSTLQDRLDAERDAQGWAGLITWPVRRAALRDALGPLVGAIKDAGPRRGPVLSDEQRASRGRYRLLLAEDYELNQKLAVRLLERVGYRCDVVENGAQALAALETGAYDLVLMDCQMPEMDGFEATRRIRAREAERGGHVPIVAMTANAMKGDRERCLEIGMDDYLSKPIHVEALYEVLEKYLP